MQRFAWPLAANTGELWRHLWLEGGSTPVCAGPCSRVPHQQKHWRVSQVMCLVYLFSKGKSLYCHKYEFKGQMFLHQIPRSQSNSPWVSSDCTWSLHRRWAVMLQFPSLPALINMTLKVSHIQSNWIEQRYWKEENSSALFHLLSLLRWRQILTYNVKIDVRM